MSETQETTQNPFTGRKYTRAVGRRKEASATVQLYTKGSGTFVVNKKPLTEYFPQSSLQGIAWAPLELLGRKDSTDVNVRVAGGGFKSQVEAIRLALSRAIVSVDENDKPPLRKAGFVTVDRRVKERKKPGLKRARRAPQWSKR